MGSVKEEEEEKEEEINNVLFFVCLFRVTKTYPTLCDPRTIAHQTPLTMRFPRQEYSSGLPFPSPRNLFILR